MGDHVFMNLLNKLRTRVKMRNNTGDRFYICIKGSTHVRSSIYLMRLISTLKSLFGVIMLGIVFMNATLLWTSLHNVTKSVNH